MPARVLIRYDTADARRRAESLAQALAEQGITVVDLRKSVAPIQTELTFSYLPDEASALDIGRRVGIAASRAPATKVGIAPRPGLIELNLSAR